MNLFGRGLRTAPWARLRGRTCRRERRQPLGPDDPLNSAPAVMVVMPLDHNLRQRQAASSEYARHFYVRQSSATQVFHKREQRVAMHSAGRLMAL